jgi:hypothetical protein
MSRALGDYALSTIIYGKFTTYRPSTGAAYTLAGTPALSVYKDNSTTQSTTGVTLTADFDGVTGLHHFAIDTSADGTFYSAGSNFDIIITTGTVDSVSVVGTVVGSFSINKTAALRPTIAGRTLDVATGGEAGLDYDNINVSAGANSALGWIESGTLQSATASTAVVRAATSLVDDLILASTIYIRSGTGAGQSRFIYDWVSATDTASVSPDWTTTPDNTSVYAIIPTAPAPTHSSTVPSVNVLQISGDATAADNCEAFFDGTGYAGTGNTIPTVTTVNGLAANVITAASIATDAGAEIADAVWDEVISGHQTTGTTGRSLTLAGAIIDETTSTGTPTTTTLQLTAGSTTDDFYNDLEIVPTSGTLVGQSRIITDYTGATRTVTIDEPWTSAPASGISVLIRAQHSHSRTQLADTVLTRQMTESYATDGTAPTLAQAICLIQQTIGDFAISGTTLTVKKLDGSTTAATYTLDSSTAPTSRTRST